MIFSIKYSVWYFYKGELFILEHTEDSEAHIWANVKLGKSFDIRLPKKYYSRKQALNKAKTWLYELLLDAKLKKTYENN